MTIKINIKRPDKEKSEELVLYEGGLVLVPGIILPSLGTTNEVYIGVVNSGGRLDNSVNYVKFSPYYKVFITGDRRVSASKLIYANRLFESRLGGIIRGTPVNLGNALRNSPFTGMEELAHAISELSQPYGISLQNLFERSEMDLVVGVA